MNVCVHIYIHTGSWSYTTGLLVQCTLQGWYWSLESRRAGGKGRWAENGGNQERAPQNMPQKGFKHFVYGEYIQLGPSKKQVPPGRIWIRIGFPGGTGGREPICQCRRHRDVGLLPGLGRFPGGGNGNPPRYSYLENPMDREVWRATAHRVTKKVRKNWSDLALTKFIQVRTGERNQGKDLRQVSYGMNAPYETMCFIR